MSRDQKKKKKLCYAATELIQLKIIAEKPKQYGVFEKHNVGELVPVHWGYEWPQLSLCCRYRYGTPYAGSSRGDESITYGKVQTIVEQLDRLQHWGKRGDAVC